MTLSLGSTNRYQSLGALSSKQRESSPSRELLSREPWQRNPHKNAAESAQPPLVEDGRRKDSNRPMMRATVGLVETVELANRVPDYDLATMIQDTPLSRRTVLKTAGIVASTGTAVSGIAAAQPPQQRGRDRAATASQGRSTQGLEQADTASDGRAGGGHHGTGPTI